MYSPNTQSSLAHNTLSAAFAKKMSVRHLVKSHLNVSRYWNMLCAIRENDVFRTNFANMNLGVHIWSHCNIGALEISRWFSPLTAAATLVNNEDLTNIPLISWTCYETGYKLVLFTNRKSHTGFQLVPKLMTLNDPEQRNGRYFVLFTEFG